MQPLRTLIITGLSGAGKSTALRAVEDLGFYCVDNLPLPLLGDLLSTMKGEPHVSRVALVVDSRLANYIEGYALASLALKSSGDIVEIIYLDASDGVLIRRFSQTRRRHPLGGDDLMAGLQAERKMLAPLRAQAVICIDTSEMNVHQLKELIQDRYQSDTMSLSLSLVSFGFRFGLPSYADLLFDVRFLPNPFFVDDLRPLDGRSKTVSDFVLQDKETKTFLTHLDQMLHFLLPRFEAEGKVYLTIGIGCTGGRHRSVAIAEELGHRLGQEWAVKVRHRDIDK
jgi:RNase adapter protein RapZ